ncbi:ribosomal protein L7/L12 [Streptomyces sp. NPDC090077]|uniref:ribosomal protein L7/L12 n=1 Tax=Streptomyces sp. NPDC090077 TaxID=3365938 RepID=UPI00380A7753
MLLTAAGDRKTEAVRAVRTVTGRSLWHSGLLLADAPVEVTVAACADTAGEAARILEAAGARTTLLCDCCGRTVRRGAFPVNAWQYGEPWVPEVCWAGEGAGRAPAPAGPGGSCRGGPDRGAENSKPRSGGAGVSGPR